MQGHKTVSMIIDVSLVLVHKMIFFLDGSMDNKPITNVSVQNKQDHNKRSQNKSSQNKSSQFLGTYRDCINISQNKKSYFRTRFTIYRLMQRNDPRGRRGSLWLPIEDRQLSDCQSSIGNYVITDLRSNHWRYLIDILLSVMVELSHLFRSQASQIETCK